jgi:SPP1 gp7 family putative phage head morphogenesis protein
LQTISKEAAIGFLNGETTPQIARRLRAGLELTQRQAEAVTRTSLNHISNQARRLIAEENRDIIKYVKWISTLDFRTSIICRFRDGKIYPVDEAPTPPAHINCRSTIVYMRTKTDDEEDLFRASKGGLVGAQTTYYEYLKRQKKEVVIDILGQKRADLFLSGKLTGDELHARDGRLLTLEELEQKLKNR